MTIDFKKIIDQEKEHAAELKAMSPEERAAYEKLSSVEQERWWEQRREGRLN